MRTIIAAILLLGLTTFARADAYCYVPDPLTDFLDHIFGNVCYVAPIVIQPVPVVVPVPVPQPVPVPVPVPMAPPPCYQAPMYDGWGNYYGIGCY